MVKSNSFTAVSFPFCSFFHITTHLASLLQPETSSYSGRRKIKKDFTRAKREAGAGVEFGFTYLCIGECSFFSSKAIYLLVSRNVFFPYH